MVQAQAQADENEILTESLTPEFLMWRQMEVMESVSIELAKGESNTVFMMPYHMMSPNVMNSAIMAERVGSAVDAGGKSWQKGDTSKTGSGSGGT